MAALAVVAGWCGAEEPKAADPMAKWEQEIRGIEVREKAAGLPQGGVVFAGSSSIRLWKLDASFPELKATNAGFGGSTIPECTHFAPRIVFPLKPSVVVFYAGDNDVAAGHGPEKIAANFDAFAAALKKEVPGVRLIFLSIKPSSSRWKLWPKAKAANDLIKAKCDAEEGLEFLDLSGPLLGADGKPRDELFRDDKLHLNEAGYAAWTEKLAPLLAK